MIGDQKHLRERVRGYKKALVVHALLVNFAFINGLIIAFSGNLSRELTVFGVAVAFATLGFLLWRINVIVQVIRGLNAVIQSLEKANDISVSSFTGVENPDLNS